MRSITISAGLKKGYALGEAIKYLENISDEKLKGEFIIDYKGQSKEYKKSTNQFNFPFYSITSFCLSCFKCSI